MKKYITPNTECNVFKGGSLMQTYTVSDGNGREQQESPVRPDLKPTPTF